MTFIMKILVVGSGGREHIIAEKYAENKKVSTVFVAPGNDYMEELNKKIKSLQTISQLDLEKLVSFAKKEKIDLVDVAMDDPLALGAIDLFQKNNIKAFGPTQKAAEIEWSKAWSRSFMKKYHLPIPAYKTFTSSQEAITYLKTLKEQPLFVKASGLALGKGALLAENKQQAIDAIAAMQLFGDAGKTFLIEECMLGEEFSLFVMCDGEQYVIMATAQDHKRAGAGDLGPNTGGMGCIAPTTAITPTLLKDIEKTIIKPFLKGMQDEKRSFTGILYLGGMVTKKGIKIIEFNARWGEPEAEVVLSGLTTDYLTLVTAAIEQTLSKVSIHFDNKIRISIAGCAKGYPNDYSQAKGKKIFGLESAREMPGITIYGSGMKKIGKHFTVNGGRLFHLVAEGTTLQQARERAYGAISHIYIEGNNLQYRTDIGWRELERNI